MTRKMKPNTQIVAVALACAALMACTSGSKPASQTGGKKPPKDVTAGQPLDPPGKTAPAGNAAATLKGIDDAFAVRFDTSSGDYHGTIVATKLQAALDAPDPALAHGARARMASLLAEWLTMVWLVEALDPPSREKGAGWRTSLTLAATNGGRGQVPLAMVVGDAARGLGLQGIPMPRPAPEDRPRYEDRDKSFSDLSRADHVVLQAIASLTNGIPASASVDRARAHAAVAWAAVASSAKGMLVTTLREKRRKRRRDRQPMASQSSLPALETSKQLARFAADKGSFAPLAAVMLRASVHRRFDLGSVKADTIRAAMKGVGIDLPPLGDTVPRGGWKGMDPGLATLALAADKAGLRLDAKMTLPAQYEAWRDGLVSWMVERTLKGEAGAKKLPPTSEASKKLEAGVCRAAGRSESCLVGRHRLNDPGLGRASRLGRAFGVTKFERTYGKMLTPGFVAALGKAAEGPRGKTAAVEALEKAALSRFKGLTEPERELPLLLGAFGDHVEQRLKAEGIDISDVGVFLGDSLEGRLNGRMVTLARRLDRCIEERIAGTRKDGQCLVPELEALAKRAKDPEGFRAVPRRPDRRPPPSLEIPAQEKVTLAEVREALADPAALARQVRVVPRYKEGRIQGMRLVGMRRTSMLRRLGFRNGDVVKTVNGTALTNPKAGLEAFARFKASLKKQKLTLKVGIERRGQPRTITVTLE